MSSKPASFPKVIKNYNIENVLGSGAFSTVCKAVHKTSGEIFACKIFPKTNLAEKGDIERFQREVNAMAFLRHDNLVALYDMHWDQENFYLFLDYCPGGELFDYIVDHDKLDEPSSALIFQQVVASVQYCHSHGVAHRDLKPENILLDQFPHIRVSDFGLCGYVSEQQLMKTFCGSPCYCAPECLCRVQYDGRQSDVWSMGVILYAMVTGEHPWNISNTSIMLRQILKGAYTIPAFVSSACKDLITKMMQVNPKDRITVDDVMKHPWLKAAAKSKLKIPTIKPKTDLSSLPPLSGLTIAEISEASAQSSQRSESGIISPFEDGDGGESSLPKLSIRSSSLLNLRSGKVSLETNANTSSRKRVTPAGLSLSSTRQRSAVNLHAQSINKNSSYGIPMMTITEE